MSTWLTRISKMRQVLVTSKVTHAKGRMLSVQADLPQLPIPSLRQTLDKYLTTVKPIVTAEAFIQTEQTVKRFADNEGPQLQELLQKHAVGKTSWLADWWLNVAYLEYRAPSVINSNPGMVLPRQKFDTDEQWLAFSSKVIRGALDFKAKIDNESLEVEKLADKNLCMVQYYRIFSSCRIPETKRDRLVCYPSNKPNSPRHIIVIHNNQFFALDVYGNDGLPLNEKQLQKLLTKIVAKSQEEGPGVGVLTTGHRDSWVTNHKRLKKLGSNAENLDKIEKSLFIVCLDKSTSSTQDSSADAFSQSCRQMLYGNGSSSNTTNRWFDKTIQFIVGRDGCAGMNYEHSPAEGPPIAALLDFVHDYLTAPTRDLPLAKGTTNVEQLQFTLDRTLRNAIETAKKEIDILGNDLQLTGVQFSGYGKNFAKSINQSPDALIQVAMQLAYYRDQGKPCATYETASTRMFQLGRTDTIRSCTEKSVEFCMAMQSGSNDKAALADAFKAAVKAHRDYTAQAVSGQGIDRHLLGLKLIAIENGMNLPDLFMDPTYSKAFHFNVSSSQVSCKSASVLCFGPVVPDGYGFCYNPRSNEILFAISAFRSCSQTDSKVLAQRLCDSFMDIKSLFIPTSKL